MNIEERFQDGIHFFRLYGDLDASSALKLDEVIRSAMESGHHKMIFNCKDLHYIASAGLGVYIAHREEVSLNSGDIVFCEMKESVYNVFKMLGLFELFANYESEDQAMAHFA